MKLNFRWVFWLPAALAGVFVIAALVGLIAVSARSVDRMVPVQRHFAHIERLHAVAERMDQTLIRALQGQITVSRQTVDSLREALARAERQAGDDHPEVRQRLRQLSAAMGDGAKSPAKVLLDATQALSGILERERAIHNNLANAVADDAHIELKLAIGLLIALPLIVALTLFLLRHRIKRPLDDLGHLLQALANQDYHPVADAAVDESAVLIQPVLRSYNHLVNRLSELEANHQVLERHLQDDVRQASETLLEQSRELARAEKMAAVGELSAAMAHEIRNPLAGIQLACTKLARDLPPGQQERIDMVVAELKRLSALLRDRVDEVRHAPEPSSRVDIAGLVEGLLSLVRYQIPPLIALHSSMASTIWCELPESGLRQALLNLVLNAAGAIGDGPGVVTVFAETRPDGLSIGVLDDGPGFPEDMVGGAIRPFVSGRADGTGLGLAIVQRFVRGVSGELVLENRAAGGASVTLRLPCRVATGKADFT